MGRRQGVRREQLIDQEVSTKLITLCKRRYAHTPIRRAALSQAVYLDPRDPKAHLYLGVLIRKRGWLQGAEDEMRAAIDLDEEYAEAHFNLAVLCLERQPPAIELARRHYYAR